VAVFPSEWPLVAFPEAWPWAAVSCLLTNIFSAIYKRNMDKSQVVKELLAFHSTYLESHNRGFTTDALGNKRKEGKKDNSEN
jgi:hypothetical protein